MQKKKIQYNRSNITKEKEKFFYVNFKIYFGSEVAKTFFFIQPFHLKTYFRSTVLQV